MNAESIPLRCAAVLPAGGRGARFGGRVPKQFIDLGGRPLIHWSISRLIESGAVESVIVAVPRGHRSLAAGMLQEERWGVPVLLVDGGDTRQESVWNALAEAGSELVAVHDAVRPNLAPGLLIRLLEAARSHDAAIPAVPLVETIHRVRDGIIVESPRRDEWMAAQTPQCFRRSVLVEALTRARTDGFVGTDEASVVARYGYTVRVLEGDPANVKVTRRDDLQRVKLTEDPDR